MKTKIIILILLLLSITAFTYSGRFEVAEIKISSDITGYVIKDNKTMFEWLYIPGCKIPVRIDNKYSTK